MGASHWCKSSDCSSFVDSESWSCASLVSGKLSALAEPFYKLYLCPSFHILVEVALTYDQVPHHRSWRVKVQDSSCRIPHRSQMNTWRLENWSRADSHSLIFYRAFLTSLDSERAVAILSQLKCTFFESISSYSLQIGCWDWEQQTCLQSEMIH